MNKKQAKAVVADALEVWSVVHTCDEPQDADGRCPHLIALMVACVVLKI